ncbi:MAG: hypothetical protein ACRDAU_09125 [Clostridium sp.]
METNMNKKSHNIIIVIVLIIVLVVIYVASSKTLTASANSNASNAVTPKKTNALQLKRDNTEAKDVTLGSGTYIVGKDINPGRYVIKAKTGEGNITVIDAGNTQSVNESLGKDSAKTVTYTLSKNEKVQISGLKEVEFMPTSNKVTDTLTTGEWNVGLDINPGTYTATAKSGAGVLEICRDGKVIKSEKLNENGKTFEKSTDIKLASGETVEVLGIKEIGLKVNN